MAEGDSSYARAMRNAFGYRVVVATIGAGLLLAGCASPGATKLQTASPTPAPSSSATPAPAVAASRVATIVIAGSGIDSVLADGTPGESIPFSAAPEEAVAFLSRAFGRDPAFEQTTEAHCSPSEPLATWDDMVKLTLDSPWTPAGQAFGIVAATGEYSGVVIETPTGESVGEDAANLVSALPADRVHRFGEDSYPYVDVLYEQEGEAPDPSDGHSAWGAVAFVEDGGIVRIAAPTYFLLGSDC